MQKNNWEQHYVVQYKLYSTWQTPVHSIDNRANSEGKWPLLNAYVSERRHTAYVTPVIVLWGHVCMNFELNNLWDKCQCVFPQKTMHMHVEVE